MKRYWFEDQRGSALLFTTALLVMLLVFGGIAIDLTYHGSVRRELQRSMDAASLAGAGNLGFDDTVFPAARAAAQNYAAANGYSHWDPLVGDVTLELNETNDPAGDIVLGIWDGANFTPSLDGSQVNAVQCNYATDIPTSFLRLLPGMDALPISASAIAVSNPPQTIPDNTCVFPIALSCCAFGCNESTSAGCGSPVTFITSSGKDEDCIEPPCTNTATWANLCDTSTPSVPVTKEAIEAAAEGNCEACNTDGGEIGTNNGMQQAVFDTLEDAFLDQYNNGETYTVTDSEGNSTYTGRGWKVFVPVINTECPPQAITGVHDVVGWTEFVMTAVVNHGTCVPSQPDDWENLPVDCPDTGEPAMRAVFGYYSCTLVEGVASVDPGPRSALGTNLRLVQ